MKKTAVSFKKMKQDHTKITMLTAYDYSMATLIDQCGVDAILVGDSLGMVCLGYPDTLAVTMADMLHHMKAVKRGTRHALLVCDMPYLSYQISVAEAVRNAGMLVKEGGAEAVKLEGADFSKEIQAIVRAQIPVMGHIGLTPQSVHMFGGYKVQGKEMQAAKKLIEDAKKIEDAGAFALVLECVPGELATMISQSLDIPTIGIGAGVGCDGQVLVTQDMLYMEGGAKKKFVKVFSNAGDAIRQGICEYISAVRTGTFPAQENTFGMEASILGQLYDSEAKIKTREAVDADS